MYVLMFTSLFLIHKIILNLQNECKQKCALLIIYAINKETSCNIL